MAEFSRQYRARTQPRRQDTGSDVQRGLQTGESIGKILGQFGDAIKAYKQNQVANKLMNTENAPRAALVSPGFAPGTSSGDTTPATQDLGPLPAEPAPSTFTNPTTGNVEPVQTEGQDASDLARAVAAARLTSSTTAPTVGSPTPFVPNVIPAGVSTAGSAPHTGGVEEMDLQKEMLAYRLQKQGQQEKIAAAQAKAADEAAQVAGTGKYALETAQKRANLVRTQEQIRKSQEPKTAKEEKNPPAVSIGSEPVIDQNQLNRHIDGIYGNGASSSMASSLASTDPDTAPVVTTDSVIVSAGPNKKITIPLTEAQTYVKQANALRLKQGLPAYRVPGEDQSVGASAGNPYIAQSNLDVYSRAPGTWIKLPNGKIAQVPNR